MDRRAEGAAGLGSFGSQRRSKGRGEAHRARPGHGDEPGAVEVGGGRDRASAGGGDGAALRGRRSHGSQGSLGSDSRARALRASSRWAEKGGRAGVSEEVRGSADR